MPSSDPKIGHTLVTYEVTFRGDPFGSGKANALILADLFPDGQAEVSEGNSDESFAAVAINAGPEQPRGYLTRCSINSDTVQIQYLFPPQAVESLAKHIAAPEEEFEKIGSALCKKYSLDTLPRINLSEWTATTQNVPCVNWLRKQLQYKPDNKKLAEFATQGTAFDWKTIRVHFALNTTPPGIESYPKQIKEQLTTLSTFNVYVGSDEDWDDNRGAVTATIFGLKPGFYVEFLKAITES